MTSLTVRSERIDNLVPDPENVRKHSADNLDAIMRSLRTFGQRKPIVVAKANDGRLVVIAGNGTMEAAKALGWGTLDVVEVPEDWDADKARAFAIADNRTAELAEWDKVALSSALIDLDAVGFEPADLGFFGDGPLLDPLATGEPGEGGDGENAYTGTINIPQYEIVGERPEVAELFDESKANTLRARIRAADVPDEIRAFLLAAAGRHTRFNYRKIAEFYPHASIEVQSLFEESALVIVDLDDAIRDGYARFADTLVTLEEEERRA